MKDKCDYNFISITRCCRAEKRYEIIINTGSEEHYKATQDFAHKLIDHAKPTTNADRIRAMTDEELVNVVPCPLGFSMFRCPIERQCGPCKREWLQQPAEEDKHEP